MEKLELEFNNTETKKLETALVVQEGTEISEEKVESSLRYEELSDEEKYCNLVHLLKQTFQNFQILF